MTPEICSTHWLQQRLKFRKPEFLQHIRFNRSLHSYIINDQVLYKLIVPTQLGSPTSSFCFSKSKYNSSEVVQPESNPKEKKKSCLFRINFIELMSELNQDVFSISL